MHTLIELLRVKQWTKNIFIVFPLIFSGLFVHLSLWKMCLATVAGFCLVTSSMYVINDYLDLRQDRLHPRKSKRPLASGRIAVVPALVIALALLISGLLACLAVSTEVLFLAFAYVLLQFLYNLRTKKLVLLDVLTISFGFQIRIWAGSVAIGVLPSVWLQICVLVLALFLGFTKRRYELIALKKDAFEHREVLHHYSAYFLDHIIVICSTLAIVFYSLYSISPDILNRLHGRYDILYSVGFVIYGIFRYLYLIYMRHGGDDPTEILLSDRPLMINIVLWIVFVTTVIYFLAF